MFGYKETIKYDSWLYSKWREYKTKIGHKYLWNYTLTRFWTNILNDIINKKKYNNFKELYYDNEFIHYGGLFKKFYSLDVLFSDEARYEWIPPNKNINETQINLI